MRFVKGKSSLMIYEKWENLKVKHRNLAFWCKRYYVAIILFFSFLCKTFTQQIDTILL